MINTKYVIFMRFFQESKLYDYFGHY